MSLVVAFAAVSTGACGMTGGDVIATIGLPSSETAGQDVEVQAGPPPLPRADGAATAMHVTPEQRGYLDALTDAGVHTSNELLALSIGSYVCQAHAAEQSDQAVWDFVAPMVRDDVHDSLPGDEAPTAGQVDTVTADYIRIATERLC
jgi:hypothetical protein